MHTSLVSVLAGVVIWLGSWGWSKPTGPPEHHLRAKIAGTTLPNRDRCLHSDHGVTESELNKSDSLPQVTTTLENHGHVESSAL